MRRAEAAAPASLGDMPGDGTSTNRTPPMITQLRALTGRAFLNVARDPYLAGLHVVLLPCVGLLSGTSFGDLRRFNEETAGIQVCIVVVVLVAVGCLLALFSWICCFCSFVVVVVVVVVVGWLVGLIGGVAVGYTAW